MKNEPLRLGPAPCRRMSMGGVLCLHLPKYQLICYGYGGARDAGAAWTTAHRGFCFGCA